MGCMTNVDGWDKMSLAVRTSPFPVGGQWGFLAIDICTATGLNMVPSVLMLLVVVVVLGPMPVQSQSLQVICQYVSCPRFLTRSQNTNIAERVYTPANWLSTDGDPSKLEESRILMIQRLLAYFAGANVEGQKLNITLPFVTKVGRSSSSNTTTHISMYMYIPQANQAAPPTPTDPLVKVVKSPVSQVYSKSFDGWTTKMSVVKARHELREAIGNVRLYDDTHFYLATYSGPLQWYNRYNEVWIVKNVHNNVF